MNPASRRSRTAVLALSLATILLIALIAATHPARAADSGITLAEWSDSASLPTQGSFSSAGGGDGYDVFFDDAGHVFNIWHHDGNNYADQGAIDCHTTAGESCGPGWPFRVTPLHTDPYSTGYVNNTTRTLWFPTNTANAAGFACVDLSNLATGPAWCGGSDTTAFYSRQASMSITPAYSGVGALAVVGNRIFTVSKTGKLLCLDTASPSTPCSGFGDSQNTGANNNTTPMLYATGGNVFGKAGLPATRFCIDAASGAACSAFGASGITTSTEMVYPQPDSSGAVAGVCFIDSTATCYAPDGTGTVTTNNSLRVNLLGLTSPQPVASGTRVYFGNGVVGGPTGTINCFDVATSNRCAGAWPVTNAAAYALAINPATPECVWKNDHLGQIASYRADGTRGCASAADTTVTFTPQLPCESGTIATWHSFALNAPAAGTYSSASLTVKTAGGSVVTSGGRTWSDVAIAADSRTVSLADLLVADTGVAPTFTVTLRSSTATGQATAALVMGVRDAVACTKVVPSTSPSGTTPADSSKPDNATSSIALTGRPDRARILVDGRTTVTIRARNRATTTAKGATITATVPRGFRLVRAPGAKVRGRTVTWAVGDLKASGVASRRMTLLALRRGAGVVGIRVVTSNAGTAVAAARILALPRMLPVTG